MNGPDLSTVQDIAAEHDGFEAVLQSIDESHALASVRLRQYRTLIAQLNEKARQVRAYQVTGEYLAAVGGGGLDHAIDSLLS